MANITLVGSASVDEAEYLCSRRGGAVRLVVRKASDSDVAGEVSLRAPMVARSVFGLRQSEARFHIAAVGRDELTKSALHLTVLAFPQQNT